MLSFASRRAGQSVSALRGLAAAQQARSFGMGRGDSIVDAASLQAARTWDEGVADGFKPTTGEQLFKDRKVVVIGVPGAFTGVCTNAHLPGFAKKVESYRRVGVDQIICVAVNDPYTMNAWKEKMGIKDSEITFFGDSDGSFTKALGLEVDLTGAGLGPGMRSNRYSMFVTNGEIVKFNPEESPADLKVSDACTLLDQLKKMREYNPGMCYRGDI